MPFWINSNGKIILGPAGKALICDECPCIFTCPCVDWPPESWPCGGLFELYAVEVLIQALSDGGVGCIGPYIYHREYKITGNVSAQTTPCRWRGFLGIDYRDLTDGVWSDWVNSVYGVNVTILLHAGLWEMVTGEVLSIGNTFKGEKDGSDPVGSYTLTLAGPRCAGSSSLTWLYTLLEMTVS